MPPFVLPFRRDSGLAPVRPATRLTALLPLLLALPTGLGCPPASTADDDDDIVADDDDDSAPDPDFPEEIGGDRPVRVIRPSVYDEEPLPLLVLLHGYSAWGDAQAAYMRLPQRVDDLNFLLLAPDGTQNSEGTRFWNATPACCDFERSNVDDVSYLWGLVEEMQERYLVDPERIYFMGHSNGGFMSYRMACERSAGVAAIVSLAGADYPEDDDCVPEHPVSVLQVHGTADDTIDYDGSFGYPSARTSAERWAERAGCSTAPTARENLDLDTSLAGAETVVDVYDMCDDDRIEGGLWTIEGGEHLPRIDESWADLTLGWLFARRNVGGGER